MTHRDARGRFAYAPEPDFGPYEIETPMVLGSPDWPNSNVVRLPFPDEPQDGFVTVFSGPFAECDAWIKANTP